jgi:hypothetical protein
VLFFLQAMLPNCETDLVASKLWHAGQSPSHRFRGTSSPRLGAKSLLTQRRLVGRVPPCPVKCEYRAGHLLKPEQACLRSLTLTWTANPKASGIPSQVVRGLRVRSWRG